MEERHSLEATSGRVLRTPRAAGAAGVLAALLLAAVLTIVRISLPSAIPAHAGEWPSRSSHRQVLEIALGLLPFAGIFFLWFMGAVRDYTGRTERSTGQPVNAGSGNAGSGNAGSGNAVSGNAGSGNAEGRAENRFFATLFLCSGLMFTALVLAAGAAAGGLLAITGNIPAGVQDLWTYGRTTLTLLASYAMRMAAVFTLSTTTIGLALRVFPRWLAWLGYAAALVLLFVVGTVPWTELVFPLWMLATSTYILGASFRRGRGGG
ncbi:pentapeptide repeat-containing protein [Streptomyces sp. NRRL S-1448]|uniref:pentapeptide repeat-containing protein n=1 Tax=Streptomyces sp. NRRL S-1448 TaxID=1463883 RepID=UPI00055FD7CE|nr:pentapeptide repeat-containing protein [Streptomyces sp. NRRL S-1448]